MSDNYTRDELDNAEEGFRRNMTEIEQDATKMEEEIIASALNPIASVGLSEEDIAHKEAEMLASSTKDIETIEIRIPTEEEISQWENNLLDSLS